MHSGTAKSIEALRCSCGSPSEDDRATTHEYPSPAVQLAGEAARKAVFELTVLPLGPISHWGSA